MTWNEIAGFGKAEKILQVGRNIALRKKTEYLSTSYIPTNIPDLRLLRGNHHFKISTLQFTASALKSKKVRFE